MKVFDADGNIIEIPGDVPVNDLTRAPIFEDLPEGALFIPIVVPAKDGMMQLGLTRPSALARSADVASVTQRVAAMEPAAADFPAFTQRVTNVEAAVAGKPAIATSAPPQIDLNNTRGSSVRAAREDHTHAARVQRTVVTLAADGTATWTFSKPFTSEPSLTAIPFQGTGYPIAVEGRAWVMDGTSYAGVTVKAYRSRPLPTLTALSGTLTLLTGVITGVNSLVTALSGYDLFGGGSLAGVKVHLSAGDQM